MFLKMKGLVISLNNIFQSEKCNKNLIIILKKGLVQISAINWGLRRKTIQKALDLHPLGNESQPHLEEKINVCLGCRKIIDTRKYGINDRVQGTGEIFLWIYMPRKDLPTQAQVHRLLERAGIWPICLTKENCNSEV